MGIDLQYTDFFKLEELQTIQDLFADATGVASIITHLDGTPITKPSNFCRLCESIVRQTPKGCKNCMKSDAVLAAQSNSLPSVQTCTSVGLMESSTQIIVHGVPVANWIIGQVRTPELDKTRMEGYAKEIGANVDDFMTALEEVPIMTKEQLFNVSKMLVFSAKQLAEKGTAVVYLKQKMAELETTNKLLHEHEELLSITLQSIGDGVISTDVNGLIANMNPMAEQLCGVKLKNVLGKPLTEVFIIISAESREIVENPIKKVLQTGQIAGLANHTVLISNDGKEYQIFDSAAPIIDKNGNITGVVLVFSDVTDKYLAEAELRESERSKSVLLSNIPGMAYRSRYDRDWTKEFISEGCFKLTGYQISDLLENKTVTFNDLIVPEFREKLWETWKHAVNTKTAVFVEYKILTADNKEKWVWEQGVPIYNKDGEIEALEGLILDISDRKRAEQQLETERTMLRTLIDNIPEKIYSKDLACRKTLANKAEIESLECSSESEIVGKDDFAFFPPEFAQKFQADDKQILETGIPKLNYEELVIDRKGNSRWMLSSKIPLLDKQQNIIGLIGISRNITLQKKYEETLTNERLLLRTIIDNIPDCIYTKNVSFQKTLANKAEVKLMVTDGIITKFDQLFVLVDSTINTTRKIMTDLRPEVLYLLGFIEAAKLQVAKFQERYDIRCDFETEVDTIELNPQQSVALYRIVQEALTNIVKHANATQVKVQMTVTGDKLILQISDNGVGIKENSKAKPESYGLIGMQERAFLLDGEFTIMGQEGVGTVVKVKIPYSENKNMNKQLEFEY